MKREAIVTRYKKQGNKWVEVETHKEMLRYAEKEHWQEWARFDRNIGASVKAYYQGNYLLSYETVSPLRTEKVIYKCHGPILL